MRSDIIYLSAATIRDLQPSAAAASAVIDRFFRLRADDDVHFEPKTTLTLAPGRFFQSLCCAVSDPAFAICKWIGVFNGNERLGLPTITGSAILSDSTTGIPLAILDGAALTAARTAATSLSAALRLGRRDARSIGFIGTGVQAHSHLALFSEAFEHLEDVLILTGFRGSDGLRRHARELGLNPVLSEHSRAILEASDIVISTVPGKGAHPFLDARHLPRGAFVSSVDLGRSWIPEALPSFDVLATDDHENSADQQARGIMPALGTFAADLSELVSGKHPGRTDDRQRTSFVFPGFALSDLALASCFYEAARARKVGVEMSG